jgi:hypothetical protein
MAQQFDAHGREFRSYAVTVVDGDSLDPGTAAAEVDKRVKRYMVEHPDTDYPTAMRAVLSLDPALKRQYARA